MDALDIILIGGGGHASAIFGYFNDQMGWKNIVVVDPNPECLIKKSKLYFADEKSIPENVIVKTPAVFCIGHTYPSSERQKKFRGLVENGWSFPALISRHAVMGAGARVGEGSVIFPGVVIGANVNIGDNCIINTGCIIEHSSIVMDNVHIAPGAVVNGDCRIGNCTVLGSNSTIVHGSEVPRSSFVKANSLFYNNPERQ